MDVGVVLRRRLFATRPADINFEQHVLLLACAYTTGHPDYDVSCYYDSRGAGLEYVPEYKLCDITEAMDYLDRGHAVLFVNHTVDLEERK